MPVEFLSNDPEAPALLPQDAHDGDERNAIFLFCFFFF